MVAYPTGDEREAIYREVSEILGDVVQEWEGDPITPEANLGSFGIESVNLVYLIAELQQKYNLKSLLFKKLIGENLDVMTLRVDELVQLIHELKAA